MTKMTADRNTPLLLIKHNPMTDMEMIILFRLRIEFRPSRKKKISGISGDTSMDWLRKVGSARTSISTGMESCGEKYFLISNQA